MDGAGKAKRPTYSFSGRHVSRKRHLSGALKLVVGHVRDAVFHVCLEQKKPGLHALEWSRAQISDRFYQVGQNSEIVSAKEARDLNLHWLSNAFWTLPCRQCPWAIDGVG